MVQGSLEKYHTFIGIDVKEIRAVLRVILNGVTDLLIYVCEKIGTISDFSKFFCINLEEII